MLVTPQSIQFESVCAATFRCQSNDEVGCLYNTKCATFATFGYPWHCAGPLQQPKGQTSVLYSVPDNPTPEQIAQVRTRYVQGAEEHEEGSQLQQQQPQQQGSKGE